MFFSFWLASLCMTVSVHPRLYKWPSSVPLYGRVILQCVDTLRRPYPSVCHWTFRLCLTQMRNLEKWFRSTHLKGGSRDADAGDGHADPGQEAEGGTDRERVADPRSAVCEMRATGKSLSSIGAQRGAPRGPRGWGGEGGRLGKGQINVYT